MYPVYTFLQAVYVGPLNTSAATRACASYCTLDTACGAYFVETRIGVTENCFLVNQALVQDYTVGHHLQADHRVGISICSLDMAVKQDLCHQISQKILRE